MRLSVSTNVWFEQYGAIAHREIAESIALVAQAGFQAMDFCFHDLTTYDSPFMRADWQRSIAAYAEQAAQCGVRFLQGHAPVFRLPEEAESVALLIRSLEASRMLGIGTLVAHPLNVRGKNALSANTAYFLRLAEESERRNVGIAIENMWDLSADKRFGTTAEELCALVDAVDSPRVCVCWDVEHGGLQGQDQKAQIRLLGDRLSALHISDATDETNIHILPYQGLVDWDDVTTALAEANYRGDFTYELQHYLWRTPRALALPMLHAARQVGEHLIAQIESKRRSVK